MAWCSIYAPTAVVLQHKRAPSAMQDCGKAVGNVSLTVVRFEDPITQMSLDHGIATALVDESCSLHTFFIS